MCHSRNHRRPVASPAEDALGSEPGLRVSDAERESAVSLLREHGAVGRLEVDELEQRLGAAYSATTRGELVELLDDLPGTLPAARPPVTRRHHGIHEWSGFLQINVLLIGIWALTGAGYFWPAWVMAWWGLALVMKSGPRLLKPR